MVKVGSQLAAAMDVGGGKGRGRREQKAQDDCCILAMVVVAAAVMRMRCGQDDMLAAACASYRCNRFLNALIHSFGTCAGFSKFASHKKRQQQSRAGTAMTTASSASLKTRKSTARTAAFSSTSRGVSTAHSSRYIGIGGGGDEGWAGGAPADREPAIHWLPEEVAGGGVGGVAGDRRVAAARFPVRCICSLLCDDLDVHSLGRGWSWQCESKADGEMVSRGSQDGLDGGWAWDVESFGQRSHAASVLASLRARKYPPYELVMPPIAREHRTHMLLSLLCSRAPSRFRADELLHRGGNPGAQHHHHVNHDWLEDETSHQVRAQRQRILTASSVGSVSLDPCVCVCVCVCVYV